MRRALFLSAAVRNEDIISPFGWRQLLVNLRIQHKQFCSLSNVKNLSIYVTNNAERVLTTMVAVMGVERNLLVNSSDSPNIG